MCKITKIPNGHRQPKFWKTSFSSYKFVIRNGSPIRYYKISPLNQWNRKIILMQIFFYPDTSELIPTCFHRVSNADDVSVLTAVCRRTRSSAGRSDTRRRRELEDDSSEQILFWRQNCTKDIGVAEAWTSENIYNLKKPFWYNAFTFCQISCSIRRNLRSR